jgi:hypothetical protein
MEPTAALLVHSRMEQAVSTHTLETTLSRLRDEYRQVKAGLAASHAVPPHRLKGLRIRLRTFLDEHRREMPRGDAAALRALIDEVDHTLARL